MSPAKTGQPDRRLQPMATMPPIPVEELDDMLSRLRLTAIRDQLDNLLEEAARKSLLKNPARATMGQLPT